MIRFYRASDAVHVARIFHVAVEGIAPAFYSLEAVKAWSARGADAQGVQKRCSDGRIVWVAVDQDDQAVAFIDLMTNGHIDMLFCDPVYAGRGLASLLYAELERTAQSKMIRELTVEASACAKPAF